MAPVIRALCAYAPDPEPPSIGRLVVAWAVTRPAQSLFAIALVAGALWSFAQ